MRRRARQRPFVAHLARARQGFIVERRPVSGRVDLAQDPLGFAGDGRLHPAYHWLWSADHRRRWTEPLSDVQPSYRGSKLPPAPELRIMIRSSSSTAGEPICGFWALSPYGVCPTPRRRIALWKGQSERYGGNIWIGCFSGTGRTWNESSNSSKSTATTSAFTNPWPEPRQLKRTDTQAP